MIASRKIELANRSPDIAVGPDVAVLMSFVGTFPPVVSSAEEQDADRSGTWPWMFNEKLLEHKERTARNRKRQRIVHAAQEQLPQRHLRRVTGQKSITVREGKNCLSLHLVCGSSKRTEASV